MGSPTNEPGRELSEDQVQVTLSKGFWMGKHEVTQAEYRQVTGRSPSSFSATGSSKSALVGVDTNKLPVEWVSWNGATEFCRALSQQERQAGLLPEGWEYRLPTEAQWEYACRATTEAQYCYGPAVAQLADFAWYVANSEKRPHQVGQKQANRWGLHDMHGNVLEWCRDSQRLKLPGGTDPEVTEPTPNRMVRGGHFGSPAGRCRSACATSIPPDNVANNLGFRVALIETNAADAKKQE
jgi:formylglycine-generating enzyme required for sulfatase activity